MLAREDAGAERIFQNNGVPLLLNLIQTAKPEMILAAVRTLSGMCTGHKARVREVKVLTNTELLGSLRPSVALKHLCFFFCLFVSCFTHRLTGNVYTAHDGC